MTTKRNTKIEHRISKTFLKKINGRSTMYNQARKKCLNQQKKLRLLMSEIELHDDKK